MKKEGKKKGGGKGLGRKEEDLAPKREGERRGRETDRVIGIIVKKELLSQRIVHTNRRGAQKID